MTEYETASLFVDFLNTANLVFSNYMAVLFAMVSASYFLAHRMGGWVAALFLFLYTIVALMSGAGVVFAFTDFANLGAWIHESAGAAPGDLAWLGPARAGGAGIGNLPPFVALMVLASYAGSIAFFFVARANRIHADEKAEMDSRP